jgi:hypothetical protein
MHLLLNAPWTARLLYRADDSWMGTAHGFGVSLALAALFGAALGAREGGPAFGAGALGVPLGLVAVAAFAAPAFYIALAHAGVAWNARALAASLAGASTLTALVLAGLAPAVLLVSVTADTRLGGTAAAVAALAVAGGLGLRRLFRDLRRAPHGDAPRSERLALVAFAAFASLLAARVWWLTLPMLGWERAS